MDYEGPDGTDPMALYLWRISQKPLLTRDQERALAQKKEAGDMSAKHQLVERNLRMVIPIAKRYRELGLDLWDLIQEGNAGLMRAIEKFDWRRGNKVSTYATPWIRQTIRLALADQSRAIRIPAHMAVPIGQVRRTTEDLEYQLGRPPTVKEVATKLKMPFSKVDGIMVITQRPYSLQQSLGPQGEGSMLGEVVADESAVDPVREIEIKQRDEALELALGQLSAKERKILELRLGLNGEEPRTFQKVGEEFGFTRERARQYEGNGLKKIRESEDAEGLKAFLS